MYSRTYVRPIWLGATERVARVGYVMSTIAPVPAH